MNFDFSSVEVCLYHRNCNDGFGAAYTLYSYLKSVGKDPSKVEFIPVLHSDDNIEEILEKVRGKYLLIVDFSYNKEILNKMFEITSNILVVDHHKTAMEDLKDLPYAVFDMSKSGAGLLFDLIYGAGKRTRLIDIIEDRDLWRYEIPFSKEITKYINMLNYDFEEWTTLSGSLSDDKEYCKIIESCLLINEYHMTLVRDAAQHSRLATLKIDDKVVTLRVVTSSVHGLISDVCDCVLKTNDDVDVVLNYTLSPDGKLYVSVRSRPSFDSSFISRHFGGGGHASASGFGVKDCGCFPWSLVQTDSSNQS